MKRGRVILLLYVALLAASHVVRHATRVELRPRPDQKTVVAGGVTMAYTDSDGAGPVMLLLHGSPMASECFARLEPALAKHARVITPDLPGFGGSTRAVPSYSIRAHAGSLVPFLDALGVGRAHVVAYSQGGGVAIELAGHAPDRVASLTLLSSIGVQELEMLGDYHLNHTLYGAQLTLLWALQELTPHFGAMDRGLLNVAYARNFCDTDQRPLRGFLERYAGPMLILQGRDDGLVPLAAALEHHRIVPQSELALFDGGHILMFTRATALAERMAEFLDKVERGAATTRANAAPARIAAAQAPFDASRVERARGIALFAIAVVLAVSTLVSEDLTCIGAGLLVARGMIGFAPAAAACVAGIFGGDVLLYLAGRYIGRPAFRRTPLKWLFREDDLEQRAQWFAKRGPVAIVLSRFVPGSRLPTYCAAGVLRVGLWRFAVYLLVAGLLWTPVLVALSALVGGSALRWFGLYRKYALAGALVVVAALRVTVKLLIPLCTWRGRRRLLSRWRRLTRWEFWPLWAFYPPVVLYILWLGLKHRSFSLFTVANPGIPAGGFVGESKSEILRRLPGEFVARFEVVTAPPASYPVVLKPDVGQRGLGVAVVHNRQEAEAYFRVRRGATIAQEYVAGHEFGVFYYRYPHEARGHIFSITEKRFPSVTGDGASTLEELILRDERAVCMAQFFLRKHAGALDTVPGKGEVVPLTELGTHCRGSVFLDGMWANSPELEAVIDEISRGFDGFYVGRYDIRTGSVEDFRRGRSFKILELNGVTSEATHIYQPGASLRAGYRALMRQWRITFEIAAQNRAKGIAPVSVRELLGVLSGYSPAPEV
jgi:pimeloyl-ACP methyl ester carboxylesterase/membrane protein DedA with SNARE-associated domain